MLHYDITVITPWLNNAHFCTAYEQAVQGCQVLIVDNGSDPSTTKQLQAMCKRLGHSQVLQPGTNLYFAAANDYAVPHIQRRIVLYLNNDIRAVPGWLQVVERQMQQYPGLYGAQMGLRMVDGQPLAFLSGWCVAGLHETFRHLGYWDAANFPTPYWEDNWLSFRAQQAGLPLFCRPWAIQHLGGQTSGQFGEQARQWITDNEYVFKRLVRERWASARKQAA